MDQRAARERVLRLERIVALRAGEERLARAAYQSALGEQRAAEEHLSLCGAAYQRAMLQANAALTGEIAVRRLPVLQSAVQTARFGRELAERGLSAALKKTEAAAAAWRTARQAELVLERASERAQAGYVAAVRHGEQKELDEGATRAWSRR